MPTPIQLIVGLGNPGALYAENRHNVGAWFVETLSGQAHCTLRSEIKFHGKHAITIFGTQKCHLLIPTTYMNESGLCVRAVAQYYNVPPEAILIVHDEIDLPPGIVRLKWDGGAGGHNGLTDVIDHLHTKKFLRLRVGVGRPANNKVMVDYVLHSPSGAEREKIEAALQQAQEVLPLILEGDVGRAMQQLHSAHNE